MISKRRKGLLGAVGFGLILSVATENRLTAREAGPEDNLCRIINDPASGDEIVLHPGEYRGGCVIRRGGTPERPLVIRAKDLTQRPHIVDAGNSANVLEISADHVLIRGLKIGPTKKRNVDAIRIFAHAGVAIDDCEFSQLGGIAIAATHTSVNGLTVRRNVVIDSGATAMYFGCHDGSECQLSNLLVERNFIQGVDAPDPQIGYGIQVKLNSVGIVRDNVIVDIKGPGIMVYGSLDPQKVNIIERNFVTGSRRSSGIVIGGGAAIVRNNITSANFEGGISVQDYANRGLLRKISVVNNTSFKNSAGEFIVPSQAKLAAILLAKNLAAPETAKRPFPSMQAGLRLLDNLDCSVGDCFLDAAALNFSPLPAILLSRARRMNDSVFPADDYYGRSRNGSTAAGAIAFPAPAITLGIKRLTIE